MPRLVIAAILALCAASASAQMYRWVDKDGKVNYTDSPPPAAAKSAQKRVPAPAAADTGAGAGAPYAVQQAAKNFPVIVYTAPNCGAPCTDGKALLVKRGVPYREIAIGSEGGATTDELKQATGGDTVPVLMIGKNTTRGFETDMWHTALDSAGYPRNAPPLTAQAQKATAAPAAKADTPPPAKPEAEEKPKGRYAPQ
jgi:glutaredoxin